MVFVIPPCVVDTVWDVVIIGLFGSPELSELYSATYTVASIPAFPLCLALRLAMEMDGRKIGGVKYA